MKEQRIFAYSMHWQQAGTCMHATWQMLKTVTQMPDILEQVLHSS